MPAKKRFSSPAINSASAIAASPLSNQVEIVKPNYMLSFFPNDVVVEKVNKVLTLQQPVNETKPTAANSTDYIQELNSFAIGM